MKLLYLLAVYVHVVTFAGWFGAMLFEDPTSVRFMSRIAYRIHGIGRPSILILVLIGAFMLFYRAELVEQWCAEGLLPNIARMKSNGTCARMETTASMLHVSAWPSIFTGTTPDKHGLYHAYVMCPGQQSPVRPRPERSPFPFSGKS